MIAIVLLKPNGAGGFEPALGFTTHSTAITKEGVSCLPGFLSSVGVFSNRANISQAQGCVPEAVEWSFDLTDWTGSVRRSVAILDGTAQLVGWRVNCYTSPDGSDDTWFGPVLGALAMEIAEAPANDGKISVSCRETWVGNLQAVGVGVGTTTVGLVIGGGHAISVQTPGLDDPVAIEYDASSGWAQGNGLDSYTVAAKPATVATSKEDLQFAFLCADADGAETFRAAILSAMSSGPVVISGSLCSEVIATVTVTGSTVYIPVSQEFYDIEEIANVAVYPLASTSTPIIAGAGSLLGFIGDDSRLALPVGSASIEGTVLSFAPSLLAAGGFRAYTLLPIRLAWSSMAPGMDQAPGSYFGSTLNVVTDESTLPDYDTITDINLEPSTSSTWTMWCRADINSPLLAALKIIRLTSDAFDRYAVDVSDRLTLNQAYSMSGYASTLAQGRWPYHSGSAFDFTSGPMYNSADPALRNSWTIERTFLGPSLYVARRSYADMDALNETEGLAVRDADDKQIYCNYQLRGVNLYGISVLSYGSSYAVVKSAYSASPADAIIGFLSLVGAVFVADVPTLRPPKSKWGRYFEPDLTYSDAARELAKEMWITLGRGTNGLVAGVEGEILQQPSITMGDRTDVITEPVVEYDQWAGEYKKKAYIAHVDEEYNSATPERYFGGWDNGSDPAGYGMSIWNHCRKAYLHHGIRASETYQAPSIYDPDTMGRSWFGSRNGRTRAQWLSLQARYMTLRIREASPSWWAGNTVQIPTSVAGWSGYNLTEFANQQLIVTEKSWDPMTLESSFEVAIPPAIPQIGDNLIQQTFDADDELIQQSFSLDDTLIQQVF